MSYIRFDILGIDNEGHFLTSSRDVMLLQPGQILEIFNNKVKLLKEPYKTDDGYKCEVAAIVAYADNGRPLTEHDVELINRLKRIYSKDPKTEFVDYGAGI